MIHLQSLTDKKGQGCNERKVNCGCVCSVYIFETSSLWAEFVSKNRCISVRLVSEEVKSIKFDNFDNSHIIVSYDKNISLIFLCERWIPCQTVTSVLCLHYRLETVHCSTKDAYTFEITLLALHPWKGVDIHKQYLYRATCKGWDIRDDSTELIRSVSIYIHDNMQLQTCFFLCLIIEKVIKIYSRQKT